MRLPDAGHGGIVVSLPEWVRPAVAAAPPCATDEARMRFVIALARENVLQGTGGPFAAAVFEQSGQGLVAVGVNSVERLNNSALHAEMLALMFAEAQRRSYTLRRPAGPLHALVSSCEPCAMCLGAIPWSGVRRVVCAARSEDARAIGFEEGPVFPESYRYLEAEGIEVVRNVLRAEARQVLDLYQARHGTVYNG